MSRLFKNRKLVRNPKFCRFCANHNIDVFEKGHRSNCQLRFCKCQKCSKNAKKVQTSKDHRKKKNAPQTNQPAHSSQDTRTESNSVRITANETAMTLKTFIESNLDDYFKDLTRDAVNNDDEPAIASSYIESLPVICVDENMNEINNLGSTDTPSSQLEITVIEASRDSIVESLVNDYGFDIHLLYHALLDACNGDYAETVRIIAEAKKKYQK
ncbi:hypothetical protein ACKWTF_013764 [Chironomus riparius]